MRKLVGTVILLIVGWPVSLLAADGATNPFKPASPGVSIPKSGGTPQVPGNVSIAPPPPYMGNQPVPYTPPMPGGPFPNMGGPFPDGMGGPVPAQGPTEPYTLTEAEKQFVGIINGKFMYKDSKYYKFTIKPETIGIPGI